MDARLDEAEYAVLKNLAYVASSNGKGNSSFLFEVWKKGMCYAYAAGSGYFT